MVPVHHCWVHLMEMDVPAGSPQHCCKIPKRHRKVSSAMSNYILWVYAGNSNNKGILWSVIWHFSSLKVWVEGVTVTRDSETLGFSHLGNPNLQYLTINRVPVHHWLLISSIGFIWWKWMFLQGPANIAARSQNPTGKSAQQCQITFCGCMLGTATMMESYDVSFGIFPH